MHGKFFLLVLAVILVVSTPAGAELTKITAASPVYIGEKNLDISSGLQGCRIIGWWPTMDLSVPPSQTITVIPTLEDSNVAFSYTIDPKLYSGHEGTWYCVEKKPYRPIFEVRNPELVIRIWDLDSNTDISGTTVPLTTNITYRVETNLNAALQYTNRPEITPADSFFTVNLTDPRGLSLHSLYSGSYGKSGTWIMPFDANPYISVSPYTWDGGRSWNRLSRNAQGEYVYPAGTYWFFITQNLNRMQDVWPQEGREGHLFSSASVTFSEVPSRVSGVATTAPAPTAAVTTSPAISGTSAVTAAPPVPSPTEIPTKATYAPLPAWAPVAGLLAACALAARKRWR